VKVGLKLFESQVKKKANNSTTFPLNARILVGKFAHYTVTKSIFPAQRQIDVDLPISNTHNTLRKLFQ